MITNETIDRPRPVDRKLRAIMAGAAILLGGLLVVGIWFVMDQFRDESTATDITAPVAGWSVYADQARSYSISYPAEGRVDVVDGTATITNRNLACPACEPTPLRMFALTLTPGSGPLASPGTAITVGDQQYPGTLVIEGDNRLVAKVAYQANGSWWLILATFTEPAVDTNPAMSQFTQMIQSIHHPAAS